MHTETKQAREKSHLFQPAPRTSARRPKTESTPLPIQPDPDPLTSAIAELPIERPAQSFQSQRLRNALDRFRWFICGTFGVLREDVSDTHIAALIERGIRDFAFMYRNFPGIGINTQEELATWATTQQQQQQKAVTLSEGRRH